jgi:hypothetical protein
MEVNTSPLTEEQFIELKSFLDNLGNTLPSDKTNYVWNTYNHIRGVSEKQPCNCGSAAGMWRRAIDGLSDWVKEHS